MSGLEGIYALADVQQQVALPISTVIGWMVTIAVFTLGQAVAIWLVFTRTVSKRFDAIGQRFSDHADKIETIARSVDKDIKEAKEGFTREVEKLVKSIKDLGKDISVMMMADARSSARIQTLEREMVEIREQCRLFDNRLRTVETKRG